MRCDAKEVLIVTIPGDVHADAVRWALGVLGATCRRWVPSELDRLSAAARLSDDAIATRLEGPDGEIDLAAVGAMWLRRFRLPTVPEDFPEGDRIVARRESESFLHGLHHLVAPDAFCANPVVAQRAAALKPRQLAAARQVGLRIPRTVMTNDVAVVRGFMREVGGRVIYKGFRPAVWVDGAREHALYTSLVTDDDLADAGALRCAPGIFQEYVPKQRELRVTIFGRACIAAQLVAEDEIDWRPTHAMRVEPHRLDPAIEARLLALMDALGLVMGTADLIVTPEGEHVFLEINEQGQFLWVEQMNSEIRLLEPAARFLAAADPRFRAVDGGGATLSLADYFASAAAQRFERDEAPRRSAGEICVSDRD